MIVLTRRVGESITIGTATITVLKISGKRVRLGIEADGLKVTRKEVENDPKYDKLNKGIVDAAGGGGGDDGPCPSLVYERVKMYTP